MKIDNQIENQSDYSIDPKFLEALKRKVKAAEAEMMRNFSEAMFSGIDDPNFVYVPPTRWQRFKKKLWSIYYFFRSRIVGSITALIYGECKQCEHDDYY